MSEESANVTELVVEESIVDKIVDNRKLIVKRTVIIGLGIIGATALVGFLAKKRPVEVVIDATTDNN